MPTRRASILRLDQMATLSSPVRQELLDVFVRMGSVSLAEVAAALGRPADGLYYHVRLLERVGLVRAVGHRTRAGRQEALYRAAAPDFKLRYAPAPSREARESTRIVTAMLRLGIRDFRRALADPANTLAGADRDVWALRTTGWLPPARRRDVLRRIQAVFDTASGGAPQGRLYAVTILLTPLGRGARRARRASKRATQRAAR